MCIDILGLGIVSSPTRHCGEPLDGAGYSGRVEPDLACGCFMSDCRFNLEFIIEHKRVLCHFCRLI